MHHFQVIIQGNIEKVATGQITIFSRLQAIQLDGEEEVSTVAKLQGKFSNATKGAVNIVDQTTGQLRNVYDILDDMAYVERRTILSASFNHYI